MINSIFLERIHLTYRELTLITWERILHRFSFRHPSIGRRMIALPYAYNYFPIPLPFISDRHYFFKLTKESKRTLAWTLLPLDEVKKSINLKKIFDSHSDAIYIDYGAGLWEVHPISENLTKVSYSLYMDSGGDLTDYLNDFFNSQTIITLFKGVLKEPNK